MIGIDRELSKLYVVSGSENGKVDIEKANRCYRKVTRFRSKSAPLSSKTIGLQITGGERRAIRELNRRDARALTRVHLQLHRSEVPGKEAANRLRLRRD